MALDTDFGDDVKHRQFGISVDVELAVWPSDCPIAIEREPDESIRVALSVHHGWVQAWLGAHRSTEAHTRARARLLQLIGRKVRACGGLSPFEQAAVEKAVEAFLQ